ncbi:unnamed protein product [Kluyveromyces dobzhanskii CBS 2104]|uniref:WGS project CCBQ000000000 data, contig 00014 n=1 Tax=Kluyveromyces dobzhanskii CBS 2104 TaxID=1427455 RepID=A0A0A8L6C9_9SACH|nr:unnamed protein product [Kluyveromyces dobzhanskii CBS 2104]
MKKETKHAVKRALCQRCVEHAKNTERMVLLMGLAAIAYEKLNGLPVVTTDTDGDENQCDTILSSLQSHLAATSGTLKRLSKRSEHEDLQQTLLYNFAKNAWTKTQYYEIYHMKQLLEDKMVSNEDFGILPQAENLLNGFLSNEEYVRNLPALNEDVKLIQWEVFTEELTHLNKAYVVQLNYFKDSVDKLMTQAKFDPNDTRIVSLQSTIAELDTY